MECPTHLYFSDRPVPEHIGKYAQQLRTCGWNPLVPLPLSKVVDTLQDNTLRARFDDEGPDGIKRELTCALHQASGQKSAEAWPLLRIYGDHLAPSGPKDVQSLAFLGRAVCVKGIVIRSGAIKVRVRSYVFECGKCNARFATAAFHGDTFNYPTRCVTKKCKSQRFNVLREYCKCEDWQQIWVQQDWKSTEGDRSSVLVNLWAGTAGLAEASDRVKIYGTMRQSFLGNTRMDARASYALDADLVQGCGETRRALVAGVGGLLESENLFTNTQLAFIREVFNEKDRFALAAASICPPIVGRPLIKAALALVLLGGKSTGNTQRRTDTIHLLMCGDPGLGKSRLLKSVSTLSDNGSFISGAATTTAGLTAAVLHQDHSVVLEAGALPLADNGVCCIDEFDKMPKIHQDGLLEAMEQQTITVAKAGIVSQLSARTSVVCACNPKNYGADFLSRALLSRFDLVMYLKDDVAQDDIIAQHLLQSDSRTATPPGNSPRNQQPGDTSLARRINLAARGGDVLPEGLLRCYVDYARRYVPAPELSWEAKVRLKELYRAKRESDGPLGHTTFRYFEALVRLSEARAKGDLLQEVTLHHVEDVAQILESGELPVQHMPVNNKRARPGTLRALYQALSSGRRDFYTRQEIADIAIGVGFDVSSADAAIDKLHNESQLLYTQDGYRVL